MISECNYFELCTIHSNACDYYYYYVSDRDFVFVLNYFECCYTVPYVFVCIRVYPCVFVCIRVYSCSPPFFFATSHWQSLAKADVDVFYDDYVIWPPFVDSMLTGMYIMLYIMLTSMWMVLSAATL